MEGAISSQLQSKLHSKTSDCEGPSKSVVILNLTWIVGSHPTFSNTHCKCLLKQKH